MVLSSVCWFICLLLLLDGTLVTELRTSGFLEVRTPVLPTFPTVHLHLWELSTESRDTDRVLCQHTRQSQQVHMGTLESLLLGFPQERALIHEQGWDFFWDHLKETGSRGQVR